MTKQRGKAKTSRDAVPELVARRFHVAGKFSSGVPPVLGVVHFARQGDPRARNVASEPAAGLANRGAADHLKLDQLGRLREDLKRWASKYHGAERDERGL